MDKHLVAIVDDYPAILTFMEEVLTDAGYRVTTGTNADDVEAIAAREIPALLMLDIRIPGSVTGLSLIHAIRANPTTATLPIIVTTADLTFLHENADALTDLGCGTLQKPFNIESLLDSVASLLPVGRQMTP